MCGFNEGNVHIKRLKILLTMAGLILVTVSMNATIRFSGSFSDYGNIIILVIDSGYLMVLAGMSDVYTSTEEIIKKLIQLILLAGKLTSLTIF